jgi:eukaryotic-like serine/threonine-protein kinase
LLRESNLSHIISVPKVDNLSLDVGIDYRNLRELLASGRWQEANRETTDFMLNIVERQAEGWLQLEDIHIFPCIELCALDQLWVKYSKGRFGFSVHDRIWQKVRGQFPKQQDNPSKGYGYETYKKFGSCVGWYVEAKDYWLNTDELSFTLDAPPGHLPSGKKWTMRRIKGKSGELRMGRGWCLGGGVSSLTARLVECQLS